MLERLGLVDGCGIDEWEADRRSRLANHLLFWIWYLPLDLVGSKLGHTSSIHSHLANIVARTGRNFKFDARTETIPGDPEANKLLRREYRKHWATPRNA